MARTATRIFCVGDLLGFPSFFLLVILLPDCTYNRESTLASNTLSLHLIHHYEMVLLVLLYHCLYGFLPSLTAMRTQAKKKWKESMLSRIVQLTEEAQLSKPKLQRWLDKFGDIYSKVVVVLSVAVALLGPLLFKWPLFSTSGNLKSLSIHIL